MDYITQNIKTLYFWKYHVKRMDDDDDDDDDDELLTVK